MSVWLFIAIVVLVTYALIGTALVSIIIIDHAYGKSQKMIDKFVSDALDGDDDLDMHYEDNRNIIDPLDDPSNS